MERFEFAGKTCVVTGAASGIGAALAVALARRGAVLVLLDKDGDRLDATADQASQAGARAAETHVVDLSDPGDHLELAAGVAERFGGADLLVNNAGVTLLGTFEQNSLDEFLWVLEVNLLAVVRLTKAFLPQLQRRPGSHLVTMSSLFGLVAPAGQVAYAASKFGVRGFSEALRHELDGTVGVTTVHPGGVRTDIAANARVSRAGLTPEEDARARAFASKALTMPPDEAARQILRAVERRRPRLVISPAAKAGDLLARLTPTRYWRIGTALVRRRGL